MKSQMKNYSLVASIAVAAFALGGCNSKDNASLFLNSCNTEAFGNSASVCVMVEPSKPTLADNARISVSDPDLVAIYSWSLTWLDTGQLITNCGGNAQELDCQFDRGGNIAVALQGQTRSGQKVDVIRQIQVLDTALPKNQAPKITAAVLDPKGSTSTFSTGTYNSDTRVLGGDGNYVIDFSQSVDDSDALSSIQFAVSFEGGAFTNVSGSSHSLTISTTGAHPVQVKATDSEGASRILTFSIVSECTELNDNDLNFSGTLLTVARNGEPNQMQFSVNTGALGLTRNPDNRTLTHFRIMFDFNGDGIFDDSLSNKILKGQTHSKTTYDLFNGHRKVGVSVLDTVCGLQRNFEIPIQFHIPKASVANNYTDAAIAVSGAQSSVMQAFVEQLNAPSGANADWISIYNKMTKSSDGSALDFVSHWTGGHPQRVECDYRPTGQLTVRGKFEYVRPGDESTVEHGMSIVVGGIVETRSGTSTSVNTTGANITNATYYTDALGDKFKQLSFTKNGACSVKTDIQGVYIPIGCCHYNDSGICDRPISAWLYTIQGAFGCEQLSTNINGANYNVSLGYEDADLNREGAYYCQVQLPEGSCGGGGGGGGTVIPQ